MTTTIHTYRIDQKVSLPDGPYGPIVKIEAGVEYGDPVVYLTVRNSLGADVTRWVR